VSSERRSRELLPSKALAAFIAAFFAIALIGILSYRNLISRSDAADLMNHTKQVEQQIYLVQGDVINAETGQRGFLLTGRESYVEPFEAARAQLPGDLLVLRQLTLDNIDHQLAVSALTPLIQGKLDELGETIRHKRAGDTSGAIEIVMSDRGKNYADKIREIVTTMLGNEHKLLAARTVEWEETVSSSTYVVFGGVALLFGMFGLIAVLSSRDYRAVAAESWTRRVQVKLTERMQGDVRAESLGEKILKTLSESVDAQLGAVYVREHDTLRRIAGHALPASAAATAQIPIGEGVTGEAAKTGALVHLRDVPDGYLDVSSATGKGTPREVVVLPASVDGYVQAVTELAFMHSVDEVEVAALQRVSEAIAVALRTAKDRRQLEELLEETQRQAEELQAQGEELRVSNEELEQQSRALQVSQTQLENQQAELEQINAQLEEQTQSLAHQRDELARAGDELQRSNEYKSQFLANMSHELRTPLNSSLILAKLLADNREKNLNEEQVKFAETIYSAGNDLLTLINDILDLSKIEAGMLDVRPEPVSIRRMIDDLRAGFQPVASQKGLELEFVVGGGVDGLETDPTRLQQIIKNLMSNALKFTERGGVTLTIEKHGDELVFSVRDTGIGIPVDQHERIFEAFRQVDAASTRKFGGTGLGLSISRDLSRLLGGDLRVASEPGHGSTFTLALPLKYAGRSTDAPKAAKPAPTASMPVPAMPTSTINVRNRPAKPPETASPFTDDRADVVPTSRSLLVIEDDIAFAKVLFDLAHELEFQALVATSAEDGLALARHYLPSAIVLDVGLPDRSGLAVLDSLKRDARTRHVPVHIVSAVDHTRTALEMGAVGYALKPIERVQLVEAIKHLEAKFTQKLRRVLIVEDDAVLRESTAKLLAGDDVETITAGTTAEALELLRGSTFDCMVVDLALPDRSGLELLEDMANGEQYGFPPVIVYTGRSLSTDQVHELEKFSRSIIIKGARSPERLLDEVTLFLHQVESELPPERQRMLRDARDREAVFEGRKILIAEDDVRNVFALTAVLEPKGAKIEIARNGREALAALNANPQIDLVLMDIMMPEMDGLEATRALRKEPRFAKLPIIALTAKAMQDDRDRCIAAGANDYIAKPLDVDKLLSLARVWIRK
jgi:signal transduction histidine kinase/CheY-like chemotaxis protein/CHASE3 domain sensor protein